MYNSPHDLFRAQLRVMRWLRAQKLLDRPDPAIVAMVVADAPRHIQEKARLFKTGDMSHAKFS